MKWGHTRALYRYDFRPRTVNAHFRWEKPSRRYNTAWTCERCWHEYEDRSDFKVPLDRLCFDCMRRHWLAERKAFQRWTWPRWDRVKRRALHHYKSTDGIYDDNNRESVACCIACINLASLALARDRNKNKK
jgi:hypothetical protein